MKIRHLVFFVSLFSLLFFSNNLDAQVRGGVKAQFMENSRGVDENIKSDSAINDRDNLPLAPMSKGGDKSRGAGFYTTVIVDNHTPYWIKIYEEGDYKGTVAPWGMIYFEEWGEITTLYGRADFDDGSYDYWGSSQYNIANSSTFTWSLTL